MKKVLIGLVMVGIIILFISIIASCNRQGHYPWGLEKDGIKTRLIPLKKEHVLGQPIKFRLEMINVGSFPKEYDAQGVDVNDKMLIKGPDGKIINYCATLYQTSAATPHPKIKPGEIVCLFRGLDIARQYHICKPGKYTVQFKGKDRSFGKIEFPPSNIVEIEVKEGKLDAFNAIRLRLIPIMPEDWGLYTTKGFGLTKKEKQLIKEGLVVKGCYIFLLPPIKGIVERIKIWHTKSQIDLSGLEYKNVSITREYLGQDIWGYVYIEITPKAAKLWPKAKEEIIKALDIK